MRRSSILMLAATSVAAATSFSLAQDAFGDAESVSFSEQLWQALEEANFVGDHAIRSYAYEGEDPHGAVLEQVEGALSVAGREGTVIVKHNFSGSRQEVLDASLTEHLGATTVMFKREDGYDPSAGDWFWAKYLPDGSLDIAPSGASLAGRVTGCIDCHSRAGGDDFVFLHDRYGAE